MEYRVSIGLETHVQLKTLSKLFCGCSTGFGSPANTHVCPVCLGYPGAMPVLNEEAVRLTVLTGLMLGSRIAGYSKFDRKSYFYPDMPKNYQISQYDKPLCEGGEVEIDSDGGKEIRITRIHLEEDVAKNTHFKNTSGVDFNRAGVPLMEIVSEPDIESPGEAFEYLQTLKRILLYIGVSNCNLEEGNIRCDVNCSVRLMDAAEMGTKTEIKNMNTFKGVLNALKYEVSRQQEVLESGGIVTQETRRWDVEAGVTRTMRTKEDAHDYRYFPEPDLMPVTLSREKVEEWKGGLPELPKERRERFISEYGLPDYDAGVLARDRLMADFFEESARQCGNRKALSNWIMTEMLRMLGENDMLISDSPVTPSALAELVELVDGRTLNSTKAKEVFAEIFENGGSPGDIVKERGLAQVSDTDELEKLVNRAISENPGSVKDYLNGKKAASKFLAGQVMRLSRGKANPGMASGMIEKKLEERANDSGS